VKTTNKTFDCLAFKRAAQLRIYDEIKDLSREDQLAYFHTKADHGPLSAWWLRGKIREAHACYCAEGQEVYVAENKRSGNHTE